MIKMDPLHNRKLNCFQDSIATVAHYYKTDFELMLLNCWGFRLEQQTTEDTCVGKRINPESKNNLDLLKNYHGIEVCVSEDNNNIMSLLASEIMDNRPVGIIIDSYYIPWDKNYRKIHNSGHILIVVHIDFIKSEIGCMDPFYQVSYKPLPLDILDDMVKSYIIFKKIDDRSKYYDLKDLFLQALGSKSYKNNFNDINQFANIIGNNFQFINEGKGYENLWYSPLIYRLGRVALGRLNFSVALEYLMDKFHENKYGEVIKNLELAADTWNMIRTLLVKEFMSKKNHKIFSCISSRIKGIAKLEQGIYTKLIDLL